MKLKPSLTPDNASAIMDSALAYGRAENLLPLTVVTLDAGGKMIASKSEDGSGVRRFDIARGKAWGALGMGMSRRLIRDRLSLPAQHLSRRLQPLLMASLYQCREAF